MINSATYQSHPVFDNENLIIKGGNCPCPVDLTPWQMQIDAIAGKTVTEKSKLRLVWGMDLDKARQFICGEWRATYPFFRYMDGETIRDIGTPRFYVEELHDVSELGAGDSWEKARYRRHPQTGMVIEDVLGPLPLDGFYTTVFGIAHHDDRCCNGNEAIKGVQCLGAFRLPTATDMQRIRRMVYNRANATRRQLAPTAEELAQQHANEAAERDAKRHERVQASIDDFMKSNGWKFTETDPTKLAHGRFHWLSAHNKSGTPKQGATVEGN